MTGLPRDGGQAIRSTLPAVVAQLPRFLPAQRWFAGKERAVERAEIRDSAVLPDLPTTLLAVVDVYAGSAEPASYFLPLQVADATLADYPAPVIARHGDLVVRDATGDVEACRVLLRGIVKGRTLPTTLSGRFLFRPAPRPAADGADGTDALLAGADPATLPIRPAGVEQSNTSVIFGDRFILKAFRRLATGINPEIEILRFLGAYTSFDRVPALIGWAEYLDPDGVPAPIGVLQAFVPNQGDGWTHVLRAVSSLEFGVSRNAAPLESPHSKLETEIADLGRTLAGLHLALASREDVPEFAPEPIAGDDVEVWRARTRASLDDALARVERGIESEPAGVSWTAADRQAGETVRAGAERLRAAIDGFAALADGRVVKTRHHGDFHLGQTLVAPDGWIIIDFEGEPLRSLAERRAKQTPLRDVAGLLRSLDYARATAIRQRPDAHADEAALTALFERARQAFLAAYVETVTAGGAPLLPAEPDALRRALLALEVEKALYELGYEIGNRPDWVAIPLGALARLVREG